MALGLSTESGGGDFTPVVKYDARAGRVFRVDRHQDSAGNYSNDNVDVTSGFSAAFDFESMEIGWALFAAGVAPSWAMVPLGQPMPAKPSDQHKQAFRMHVKLGKSSGGDVREFASQAKVVIGAIDAAHTAYEAEKAKHPGQIPILSLKTTTPVTSGGKGQSSTNYAPVFEVVKWVDRAAAMAVADAPAEPPPPVTPPTAAGEAEF